MKLLTQTGEKTEKEGKILTDISQQEEKTVPELLEQIERKLDLLLADRKMETEVQG